MSALDEQIDDLYRLTLGEFTGARNALAKSLTRDEAARVKALAKPAIVAWAANQVYWRARSTYDRLMRSGKTLRAAQIAALEGRAADVHAASDAHRRAIGDAVAEAGRLAAPAGARPNADALARTFEALSLAVRAPEPPGRLTEALQPAGLEALTGIRNVELGTRNLELRSARAAQEAARIAAERAKHDAAVREAEALVARAEMKERSSRETWERAHDELRSARQALAEARSAAKSAI